MSRTTQFLGLGACLSLFAAACQSGPDYRAPDLAPPSNFSGAPAASATAPAPARIDPQWWTMFGDGALGELETAALAHNPDLSAAASRVVEARAAAKSVAGSLWPSVSVNPAITRQQVARGGSSSATTNARATVDVAYEVDVWGRVRREREAADAQARASAADFGVVLETLTADVAQNYFSLRGLDDQATILARSIELFRRQVDLAQTLFQSGIAGQTDVLQAKTQLEAAQAQAIEIQRQRADLEHALVILTGRAPSELSIPTDALSGEPPTIPIGLPAELLRRRPDIVSAEEQLIAANANVGVAEASFYPSLQLTGAAGFESADIGTLFEWVNRFWSLGAAATAPIFEGGALSAAEESAKAHYDELRENYRSSLLTAIGEVEDALTDVHLRFDAQAAQDRAVDAAREYLRLTDVQYRQGLVAYLQVIDAERTLLTNEISASQIKTQRFVSSVSLVKALGGGWTLEASNTAAEAHPATGPSDPKAQHARAADREPR